MKLKVLLKIWFLLSIFFIIFVFVLTLFMGIKDINIITKPLPTLVSLSLVIPMAIIFLSGVVLLDKAKKRALEIG